MGVFRVEVENSRWTYSYDPGRIYGPPEDCYPPSFEIDDYVDGGISIYYDGELAAWLSTNPEELGEVDTDDGRYVYGDESYYEGDMQAVVELLNQVMARIESDGYFTEDDDEDLFVDVSDWGELLRYDYCPNYEYEIYPAMPDFDDIASKRR